MKIEKLDMEKGERVRKTTLKILKLINKNEFIQS